MEFWPEPFQNFWAYFPYKTPNFFINSVKKFHDFVLPCLRVLVENPRYAVVGVFTQPDKPQGRGKALRSTPVKLSAEQHGIPVFQPEKLQDPRVAAILRKLSPDVAVTAAYGKIIPEGILSLPPSGFLNIHPSLLPVWRGPSPLQFALWHNTSPTVVTIMKMDVRMDTGPILSQSSHILLPQEDFFSLSRTLFELGARDLDRVLPQYLDQRGIPVPQDDAKATYSRLLTKEDGRVDFSEPATEIERKIRAFALWPGVFHVRQKDGLRLRLVQARAQGSQDSGVLSDVSDALVVPCARQTQLLIEKIQPAGGKVMSASEFIRGFGVDII